MRQITTSPLPPFKGGLVERAPTSVQRHAFWIWAIICLIWTAASAASDDAVLHAIQEAEKTDAAYWNALYLWLRVAGVAWIALEWVAAILLWRGYRLMSAAARARGLMP